MKLLEAYILRRVWTMFLTALLPVLAIIWTTQVLNRINLVTDSGQSIGSFMKLASLILPTLLPTVMPFALVIGITQTLTMMNNDSELAVIDAAGASRGIVYRPLISFAVLLCIFSFVMTSFVEPRLRVSVREMIAAAYADLLSTVIEEKTFRRLDDGLYVQISQRLSGRILKGLFVADSRDPAYDMIYYAREGAVDETGKALIMRDGEVERKTPDGNVSIVRFDSYSFDLSELSQSRGEARLHAGDRDLSFLLSPDPNDKDYVKRPQEYRAELHKRLSGWLYPLAFALISLVVAGDARSHREARLHPMVSALTLAIGLFWLSNYTVNLVESSATFIPFVYAVPLGTIVISGSILARGRGLRLPGALERLFGRMAQSLRQGMSRVGGSGGGAS
ncbi:LPS export ABC transporter permease LptF [Rhizobium halophytocola]|uniref:Lipopolysaccharide export system permease protein n=1 Tax=Rhizobium halophytocola TaxID=735519 RepID=A0ABS4DYM6_9HYPH|nr:LPS export ABC transporter permease LptF [Rhizobium halophytocola]MBP1850744.1 lipopolysaccharide export system permease protein [Rhizobium halophytocola]